MPVDGKGEVTERHRPDEKLAAHLSQSLDVTQTLLSSLLEEIRQSATQIANLGQINKAVEGLTTSMRELSLIVRGERGDNGLTARLRAMETKCAECEASKKEARSGEWQIRAAWILGLLSLLGSVISLITIFKK
jgi:hypothetical protein